ncbi:uncharacterized protein LOC143859432 [Tasmannia lanceolata]|uniref:uncharacterized protein LOC143859432 n=1 Tax=Tasmannia lanceolata TaxID=3420 RepID=UPI004063D9DB
MTTLPTTYAVRCKERSYPWRVTGTNHLNHMRVKTFIPNHTCSLILSGNDHSLVTAAWAAETCLGLFGRPEEIKPSLIINHIKLHWGIVINYRKAHNAKDIIIEIKCGNADDSYRILPAYAHELVRSNYGSIIHILRERELFRNGHDSFLRLFWAFGPSIRSFNRSLRPLVLLDETHLRGKYHAILLVACGVDGDGGLFPISFAFVENENEDIWNWFLTHFRRNIMSSENKVITVCSDRQKGLIKAVPTVLPNSYHSFCMRHLSANFYVKFKDDMLYAYFWAAAKALCESHFRDEMDKIKARNERAHKYIIEHWPKEHWASCYFQDSMYDVLTMNRSECFNAILKDARTLPIASLVEHIRWKISNFFQHCRKIGHHWKTKLTPNAETR